MEPHPESNSKQILAEKKIIDIITEGLYLFVRNYGKIILPFIILLTISNFLIVISVSQLEWYANLISPQVDALFTKIEETPELITDLDIILMFQYALLLLFLGFLEGVIGAFFTTLSMALVSSYLYKKYTKTDEINDKILNKNLFLVLLLIGCGIPFGFFIAFIVPGIILFVFFIFSLFTFNLKDVDNPVKEARLIAKGSYFNIVIVFLFSVIITILINSVYQNIINLVWPVDSAMYDSWLDPLNRNYMMLFLYSLIHDIAGILFAPLFISTLTVLFATSKAKKDLGLNVSHGYGQRIRPSDRYQVLELTEKSIYEGFFCPFCGGKIAKIKKFCPNCGESLEGLNL